MKTSQFLLILALIALIPTSAFAGTKKNKDRSPAAGTTRIACDDSNDRRVEVYVSKGLLMLPGMAAIKIPEQVTDLLAQGNFKALDKKAATDAGNSYKFSFRIDGYTVDHKARLEIRVVDKDSTQHRFSSCLLAPEMQGSLS